MSACAEVIFDDPKFLRLTPAAHQVASAWASRGDAASLDILGLMRFDDFTNGIVVSLPVVLTVMLVLQYHFHAPHSVLGAMRFVAAAALPGFGVVWGFARRRLTDRAIRRYRWERVGKDVFEPVRGLARRLPQQQAGVLSLFRRGWSRVADSPAPRLSARAS